MTDHTPDASASLFRSTSAFVQPEVPEVPEGRPLTAEEAQVGPSPYHQIAELLDQALTEAAITDAGDQTPDLIAEALEIARKHA